MSLLAISESSENMIRGVALLDSWLVKGPGRLWQMTHGRAGYTVTLICENYPERYQHSCSRADLYDAIAQALTAANADDAYFKVHQKQLDDPQKYFRSSIDD